MAKDLGIDLGSSQTTVYIRGKGIVLTEPSCVAISKATGKPIAVGAAAEKTEGRTPPGIVCERPIKNGAIANFELAEFMLKYFVSKAIGLTAPIGTTKMIIGVHSNITEVEELAVLEAAKRACGGKVRPRLIEVSLAAGIGAGLSIENDEVEGSMVLDIGGGTSEAAVFSLGGIISQSSVKVGGDKFNTAIVSYLKQEHGILIGEKTAEKIKTEVATVFPQKQERSLDISGRSIMTGLPASINVTSKELSDCIREPAMEIANIAKKVLDNLPAEISADIAKKGIVLTGGGALLTGFCEFLRTETNVPCRLAENTGHCTVLGIGKCLSDNNMKMIINAGRL